MTYSEQDFERMKTDPVLRRQYFWHCAMIAKRDALQAHDKAQKESFEDGKRVIKMGELADRFNQWIVENMDDLVKSTGEEET